MRKYFLKKLTNLKIIIILTFLICSIISVCNRNNPILKNNQCVSIYCTEEQFKTGECIIDEPITKTQWLNNIIKFENTNGDIYLFTDTREYDTLIFSTTTSNNQERIFSAMKFNSYNGNIYFFEKNNEYVHILNEILTMMKIRKWKTLECFLLIIGIIMVIILL